MSRILLIILIFFLMMVLIKAINFGLELLPMSESMMALGFVLIAAYLIGKMGGNYNLPLITGYLFAGIVAGPFVVNLISPTIVSNLQLIDKIALGLIALTAGGEFHYSALREQFKTLISVFGLLLILMMAVSLLLIFLVQSQVSFMAGIPFSGAIGVGLLFGIISLSMSPATTIAIITETRAKGRFTDFVLGMTIFIDIAVVLLFSVVLALSKPLITGSGQVQLSHALSIIKEILLSVGVGAGAGILIILYLKYVGKEVVLFILGFLLLGIEMASMFHLELILLFVVAGFVVQNFSNVGHNLIEAIERSSLPIYVIFFATTGASLNFDLFFANWILALLLVSVRLGALFGGTYLGARFAGASPAIQNFGWMGFASQAGISLGIAVLVAQNIPGEIGSSMKSLVVATIAINQIIGPILFRYSLSKTGEITP
ncbi:MAG: hypothetical protein Kow0042_06000 [Calditrichia bacterium]